MTPVFGVTAAIATLSALMMVTRRNPVYSAVWLLICFLSVAAVFLQLAASFLAAVHVIVYTGAILVLFVFVIMLLNLQPDELGDEYPIGVRLFGAAISSALFLLVAIPAVQDPKLWALPARPPEYGTVAWVGRVLFTDFALPFELVSLLIVVAMFGSMVLAKKKPVPSRDS